jgi:hypothetical protein
MNVPYAVLLKLLIVVHKPYSFFMFEFVLRACKVTVSEYCHQMHGWSFGGLQVTFGPCYSVIVDLVKVEYLQNLSVYSDVTNISKAI